MTSLKFLDLSYNQLTQLTNSKKISFPFLNYLILYNCPLISLDPNVETEGIAVNVNTAQASEREPIDQSMLKVNDELTADQKKRLMEIIEQNAIAFQWSEYDTGITDLVEHNIDTGDEKPIKQRQYRLPQTAQAEVEKQVSKMLENGIIEESKSPWTSPIILVKKKSKENSKQEYGFCINF